MNNNSQSHPWRRAIVALLSLQMALGPLASPAYAAVTLLADEPIGFSPSAPPNIMLTIDDSTSMLSDHAMLDFSVSRTKATRSRFGLTPLEGQ